METRLLNLEDLNNKLECFGFTVIHFSPPKGVITTADFNRLYVVKREDGKSILVKLVDFARIPFGKIGSILTIPATGFEAHVWRQHWLQKHPNTRDETEMAVYCYIKQR
ncbi:MAG TPA: hypothetical protein VEB42_03650 [Chitinophagaceae bacterium]|nr:hypothetical protein [Chitinophagaceae bacterium]